VPPVSPTLAEARAVAAEVARGERSAESAAAWALDRVGPTIEAGGDQEIIDLLAELSSGWMSINGELRPSKDYPPDVDL
jgi:hypothetical protein